MQSSYLTVLLRAFLLVIGACVTSGCSTTIGTITGAQATGRAIKDDERRAVLTNIPPRYSRVEVASVPKEMEQKLRHLSPDANMALAYFLRSDRYLSSAVGIEISFGDGSVGFLAPGTYVATQILPGNKSIGLRTVWGYRQIFSAQSAGGELLLVNNDAHTLIYDWSELITANVKANVSIQSFGNPGAATASGQLYESFEKERVYFFSVEIGGFLGNEIQTTKLDAQLARKLLTEYRPSEAKFRVTGENLYVPTGHFYRKNISQAPPTLMIGRRD